MRWICWAVALSAICGLASEAVGFETTWNTGMMSSGGAYGHAYCASPCASSLYGTVPGCCDYPPSCCDNAWAGYCEEKARCHAFWHRVGAYLSGCGRNRGCYDCVPSSTTCCETEVQSAPVSPAEAAEPEASADIPLAPMPVPDTTTRNSGVRRR